MIYIIIIAIFVLLYFGISPKDGVKKAVATKNRSSLTNTIFAIAQQQGDFWRIDFIGGPNFTGFTVVSRNNSSRYYSFNELGYSDINSFKNYEFLKKLKKETERRKGYYYPVKRTSAGWTGGFSSYDGGNSYQANYDSVSCVVEIHLYSREYYQMYRPYVTNNQKQSNRYKNV